MISSWKSFLVAVFVFFGFVATQNKEAIEPSAPVLKKEPVFAKNLDPVTETAILKYDDFVRERLTEEQIPGIAVVIVKNGEIIFSKGYGVRTTQSRDSINVHTVFRLASLSKGFAGVLAGLLVKEGHFIWDDPVSAYVRDFKLYKNLYTDSLKLRHVLSHTTGLPKQAYSNLIEANHSYAEARTRLSEVRPTHKPGVYYNYQNVAFSLVGDVAERTTGRRFEDLLYSKIFMPLNMSDAGSGYQNFLLDTSNIAWPHKYEQEKYRRYPVKPNYYEVLPAAGVNASISDMGQWLLFLLGHRPDIMDKTELSQLFDKQIVVSLSEGNHRAWPEATEAWYGFGWRGVQSKGRKVIFHGGYVNSFRAEIAFIPEEDIGIAVLSNAPSGFMHQATPYFWSLYSSMQYAQN
jgi:beta-lactamase class C